MIELITAIVIVSIISVMAGMGLVQLAKGYYLAKTSTVAAQQAQIALARLAKELAAIHTIDPAQTTPTSLRYKRKHNDIVDTNWRKIAWTAADQPLTLNIDEINNDTLIDKVQAFSVTYYKYNYATQIFTVDSYSSATAMIELTFRLKGYGATPLIFIERVVI
jgi:Tfp pilus assembly protein FimT